MMSHRFDTAYYKIFKNVRRSTVKYDIVWIKDFPHLKHCKLLHTTYGLLGLTPHRLLLSSSTVCCEAEKQETKWSSSVQITTLPDDPDKVQTAHFHVQHCPWLFSILCLWLCNVDPFSSAQFVGYKTISMPTKSGCFFFSSDRFCMKCPGCIPASHWPTGLYRYSVSPRSYAGINTDVAFRITSKGLRSSHYIWETSGPVLHIFRPSHFYRNFACTAHFILNSTAHLCKQKS